MQGDHSPFLPGMPGGAGRPRRPVQERLQDECQRLRSQPLYQVEQRFSRWLSPELLQPAAGARQRHFGVRVVFWALLYQLLARVGCAGAVKQVQQWAVQSGSAMPSSRTGAYCQARARLPLAMLLAVGEHLVAQLERARGAADRWQGLRLVAVDGTGLSMPDTAVNQAVWPQSRSIAPGRGFPELKLVGLFSLASGALLGWVEGNRRNSEQRLWQGLWPLLCKGDLVLGDRGFDSYLNLAMVPLHGAHLLVKMTSLRKPHWEAGRRLGPDDQLQQWRRPRRPDWCSPEQWAEVPQEITVRMIRRHLSCPGFRTTTLTVVTTLLDPVAYPADELIELYRQRWQVELRLRDIKQTLGMAVLASKSPEQIRKELAMYTICYNLLRALMVEAAHHTRVPLARLSFKATVEQLCHWHCLFTQPLGSAAARQRLLHRFYLALASAPNPHRPNRQQPRQCKRRTQRYPCFHPPRPATTSKALTK